MDLPDLIKSAVRAGRLTASNHARRRLRQRKVEFWQIEAGVDTWLVVKERPQDQPNPSIVCEQRLPDGTTIIVVWAWDTARNRALLVTVYFPA